MGSLLIYRESRDLWLARDHSQWDGMLHRLGAAFAQQEFQRQPRAFGGTAFLLGRKTTKICDAQQSRSKKRYTPLSGMASAVFPHLLLVLPQILIDKILVLQQNAGFQDTSFSPRLAIIQDLPLRHPTRDNSSISPNELRSLGFSYPRIARVLLNFLVPVSVV